MEVEVFCLRSGVEMPDTGRGEERGVGGHEWQRCDGGYSNLTCAYPTSLVDGGETWSGASWREWVVGSG